MSGKRYFFDKDSEGKERVVSLDGLKIYGICLERLRYQIKVARAGPNGGGDPSGRRVVLESYRTGNIDDIVDILELYDVREKSMGAVREKLDELAENVSLLAMAPVEFDFSDEGWLCLYLLL